MKKVVVLDAVPLDQGDVDWSVFEEFGDVAVFERTSSQEVLERCREAQIVLSNKVVLDRTVLLSCSNLSFVQVMATGANMIDLETAKEKEVAVCNVPSYSTFSVVEHVFSLLFEMLRGVSVYFQNVNRGDWAASQDFSFFMRPYEDLSQKHLGIVGSGNIGQRVAQVAQALGMKVSFAQIPGRPESSEKVPLNELLPQIDILSLHCPLTSLTKDLMNKERFLKMPKNSYFINTSRGPLVVEKDLRDVLDSGHLAGVGLDVLCQEPPDRDHLLVNAPRCRITPHIAWGSVQSRQRMLKIMYENIKSWTEGKVQNLIC